MKEAPMRSIINPDDPCFAAPKSMLEAIRTYCEAHNQPVPETPARFCRCIFDSLAQRYKTICTWLQEFAPFRIDTLHIIGGGSVNAVLDQLTADALGIRVLAGPQEATALGNIMLQAKANGVVKDRWEMRKVIANSIELKEYTPNK
jgi:rhamnulokinase